MSLSQTIKRLKRTRAAFGAASPPATPGGGPSRLAELDGSFDNPGNLRARIYVPADLPVGAPLLVVLHGCTQNAEAYDRGAGWSQLADRHGFALLYPEQKRDNNPNLCFNWYQRSDATRGGGETASIAAMVQHMQQRHGLDRDRAFVTGLSAGGAMAAVMLAAYPELFAGGAIIAGLPYGCASTLQDAFECMGGRGFGDPARLADKVRAASPHRGAFPRVSIWQGSADRIVAPANAQALVRQWTGVHGLGETANLVETVDGHRRQVWLGREGQELVEYYDVAGMAHGTPLMPGTGAGQSGQAGPHMLDVGLSSTDRIAAFFGIGPEVAARARAEAGTTRTAPEPGRPVPPAAGVQKTIEDALRSAGLMR